MKVLLTSAEVTPFAKVGGLADVAGALPYALQRAGVDTRVIMPGYGFIQHFPHKITRLFNFPFEHRYGTADVNVYTTVHHGVPFYFVQATPFFGSDQQVYLDWDLDIPRFIFFNQISMATAWELGRRLGWFPDVIHVNDWHTGLIPFLLETSRWKKEWASVSSIMTIHNIAYQGAGVGGYLWDSMIPARNHPMLREGGLDTNMLAIGIAYADMISTVSPRYAQEIQYQYAGYNLADLIQTRADDLVGILNGLDDSIWKPSTDPTLIENFDTTNFETMRPLNKRHLQAYSRLPVDEDVMVIGMVSRLTWQKGFDIATPALRRFLQETDSQLVILGTGDAGIENDLLQLQAEFPQQVKAFLEFDAALAQHIYAGSDLFLMPSHFEPCGIGQLIAMKYGSLPLVRETGGLADTVTNFDGKEDTEGTGFIFKWEEVGAVLGTLRWAEDTFKHHKVAWRQMQQNAMRQDFNWSHSAEQYIDLYERAIRKQRNVNLES